MVISSTLFYLFYFLFLSLCVVKPIKGTAMQTEKALIIDLLRASELSWKFRIATIYNFAVIYPWNLQFSEKVAYHLLTVSFVFSVYKQNFTSQ